MPAFVDTSADTVRVLLDLADNRRDVQTTTDYGSLSVRVPDYLYERWVKYQSLDSSSPIEPKKKKESS
jgi:hypothetical protein